MNNASTRAPRDPKPQSESDTPPRRSWSAATIQFLTQSEMRALLAAIDSKRAYALFLLAYRHGLRASEVRMLRVKDLDLSQYRLRIQRLKHSLSGLHPLQPDEVKAVKAYLRARGSQAPSLFLSNRNEPISRRTLDKLMKKYGGKAKLPDTKQQCVQHATSLQHVAM